MNAKLVKLRLKLDSMNSFRNEWEIFQWHTRACTRWCIFAQTEANDGLWPHSTSFWKRYIEFTLKRLLSYTPQFWNRSKKILLYTFQYEPPNNLWNSKFCNIRKYNISNEIISYRELFGNHCFHTSHIAFTS